MTKAWQLVFTGQAIKQLKKLDISIQKQILDYLQEKVLKKSDPTVLGKALIGSKKGIWRYRTGNYRILCQIRTKEVMILVLDMAHRKNIYK